MARPTLWEGGYNASDSIVTLNNSTVKGNSASAFVTSTSYYVGTEANGGGIFNWGTVTLNNSTISGNSIDSFGYGCTSGGGICNFFGTVTLSNSTISGNTVSTSDYGYGGGIDNDDGTVTLTNSTVNGNTANGAGGGIYNGIHSGGTITLYSSLISGNTAGYGNEVIVNSGTITAASSNLFGHNSENNTEAFVGFMPTGSDINATSNGMNIPLTSILDTTLADNGGPTWTHALPVGSPAIDLDAACSTNLDTDQRGYPRPETEGTGCDAGAFEGSIVPGKNTAFLPAMYLLLL
ncbi:MAG: choice-of-anchor Q domain-containing protein [Candidatus Electrothrix sp. GW3-4]|uniref:choice-of-anchor Q domain-containing protein n=1 Tax=Candidatus Electrothrix sp. GW3-4 TaxID=3126740 RepID=UPI0030CA6760